MTPHLDSGILTRVEAMNFLIEASQVWYLEYCCGELTEDVQVYAGISVYWIVWSVTAIDMLSEKLFPDLEQHIEP
jgi:hypothetical protein